MAATESMCGALGIIVQKNVRVRMRDGVRLSTNVFRPECPGRFPGLLLRTPYGKGEARYERFVRAGYIVVTQDTRGRYDSEGEYTPFTVEDTKDAEDGYDAVEWLAAQPYCNGKVGTFGASYCAWMQWKLARLRPPHLKAMCAVSIPTNLPELDFPGAFRPARRLHWWINTIAPDVKRREGGAPPHTPAEARPIWDEIDRGKWLNFLPWSKLPRHLLGRIADYVFEWFRNPTHDPWKFLEHHKDIEVPNLDFTGWYDHCCSIGHFVNMRKVGRTKLSREQQKIVIGPWNHSSLGSRKVGDIDFGPNAQLDKEDLMLRWFDHWLKGTANDVKRWPPVQYFVMGSNQWKSSKIWPPTGARDMTLYLRGNRRLSKSPRADDSPDHYVYDPADPVMTLWPPALFTVPSDRRKLLYRRDILRYETPPLERDVECVGGGEVVLYASSSARDTDFFARLVDVHPDGLALDVSLGMVRARYRGGLEREQLLTPGEIAEYRIKLGPTACRFLASHKIQLEITSSDFPNYDRNHNTGRDDFSDPELLPAQQKVYHSSQYPSRLILRIQK
jgi:putative CocE/NonD family hydrolase